MNGMIECLWVGIDVSKCRLDVARLDDKGKVKLHRLNNDSIGFAALQNWLAQRGCKPPGTPVFTEAARPGGEERCTFLCNQGWSGSVVNPARIKGFAQSGMVRNKTDNADAFLFRPCLSGPGRRQHPNSGSPRPWWIGFKRPKARINQMPAARKRP